MPVIRLAARLQLIALFGLVVLAFCALAVIACNGGLGGVARAQTSSPWQQLTNQPPFGGGAMLLLTDGTVIGSDGQGNWWRLTPEISGSYVGGTWSQIASLPSGYRPDVFASAVLPDGRVIIEGGEFNGTSTPVATNQGAIYDPIANAWTAVQPPSGSGWSMIGDAPSVVLSNGTFLLGSCCSSQNALLNADSLTWTATGVGKLAPNTEAGFTLLPDGGVLTVDVYGCPVVPGLPAGDCGPNSEIYSPATGQWTSAGSTVVQLANQPSDGFPAEIGPQVLRPDGTVVVFGGTSTGGPAHTAIYNSSTRTWSAGPDIPAVNGQYYTLPDYPAALLPSGNVLFAAGPQRGSTPPTHWFVFDGAAITQVPDNFIAPFSSGGQLLVLPTGQILYSGEFVYNDLGAPNPAWAPVISSVPATLVPGATYQVSGLQLNGLSQGAMFGDDWQMATNYPLVRITNNATGHVFYARTFGHSSMSVTPNALSFTNFTLPADGKIEVGASQFVVVANGIASQPVSVTIVTGNTVPLAVSLPANGGVVASSPPGLMCPGNCTTNFASGTVVSLTEIPASGFAFAGWGGACSGLGTCTVAMGNPQSVSATFTQGSAPATPLVAAVLPASRSVEVGVTATAFATIINSGATTTSGCAIAPAATLPVTFHYQTTNPSTNQVTGTSDTPVAIAAGAPQSFVVGLTANAAFAPTNLAFSFACTNVTPAPSHIGLNTLLLSASTSPVPDVVALAATAQNDGIVHVTGSPSQGAFAVATVNLGAGATITASANTGGATLPLTINLCQTNPATGQCISAVGPSVTTTIGANATPTFAILVSASATVAFDPANSRIAVQFADSGGAVRGETSVAVETQ